MSNYYNISCSLDTIQYKLENVAHTLEIIAEHISDDPNSGAVWCMYDVVKCLSQDLQSVSGNVMDCHLEEQKPVKKSKKK